MTWRGQVMQFPLFAVLTYKFKHNLEGQLHQRVNFLSFSFDPTETTCVGQNNENVIEKNYDYSIDSAPNLGK